MGRHRMLLHHGRLAVALVTTAVVVGGVAASLGAGYAISHAVLGDGSAYVAKGTAAAHVNGADGKVDAQTPGNLGIGKQPISIVALPGGMVASINKQTGKVTILNGSTMKPVATSTPTAPTATSTAAPATPSTAAPSTSAPDSSAPDTTTPPAAPAKPATPTPPPPAGSAAAANAPQAVVSGGDSWLADPTDHTVALISTAGQIGRPVDVGAPIADVAPGVAGGIVVLTDDGTIVQVGTDLASHRFPITGGRGGDLTTASGHPYLFTTSGAVIEVDGTPRLLTSNPTIAARRGTVAGSVASSGAHLLFISDGTLSIIDPAHTTTQTLNLHAGGADLGRPIEFSDRVYIPDYTPHRLLVVTEQPLRQDQPIAVPGSDPTFALFVSGNRAWANDQYSQQMIEIAADGTLTEIDKGTGDGVVDGHEPPAPGTTQHASPPRHGNTPPAQTPVSPSTPPGAPPSESTPAHGRPASPAPGRRRAGSGQSGNSTGRGQPGSGNGDGRSGTGHSGVRHPGGPSPTPVPTPTPTPTSTPEITVPSFPPGTNYADACATLRADQLQCSSVAVGSDAGTGNTGDVVRTSPKAGTKVPTGSTVTVEYLGQVVVPSDLLSQTPDAACAELAAVPLTCVPTPDPTPVSDASTFGVVSGVSPAPGTKINKDATVKVSYPDHFTVPNLANLSPANACLALNAFQVTVNGTTTAPSCQPVQGTAPPSLAAANLVYAQTPAPGSVAVAGQAFTVTYYKGNVTIPSWIGGDAQTALAQCNALAIAPCTLAVGDSAGTHPQWAGLVENQSPQAGTFTSVAAITIWEWSGTATVPSLTNQSVSGGAGSQACASLVTLGLQCALTPVQGTPGQAAMVVLAQNVAAGSPVPLGTQITLNFTPAAAQPLYYDSAPDYATDTLSLSPCAGCVESAWWVYPPGSGVPGTQTIYGASCPSTAANCNGHANNVQYTRASLATIQQLDGQYWTSYTAAFDLVAPASCSPGAPVLSRAWYFTPRSGKNSYSVHTYSFGTAQPGGTSGPPEGHEVLGCPAP